VSNMASSHGKRNATVLSYGGINLFLRSAQTARASRDRGLSRANGKVPRAKWLLNHSDDKIALGQCFSTAGPRPSSGPREALLEFVILNVILCLSTCHTVYVSKYTVYVICSLCL
jgi:hypothetical protein